MRIYEFLSTGAGCARTAKELKEILHLSEREFRQALRYERLKGVPICSRTQTDSSGKAGYYLPENAAEYQDTIRQLKSRERKSGAFGRHSKSHTKNAMPVNSFTPV